MFNAKFFLAVKTHLAEQTRCIEWKLNEQTNQLSELHEFCKRRAELETDYSRGLDKLVKQTITRCRGDKLRYDYLICLIRFFTFNLHTVHFLIVAFCTIRNSNIIFKAHNLLDIRSVFLSALCVQFST